MKKYNNFSKVIIIITIICSICTWGRADFRGGYKDNNVNELNSYHY